MPQVFAVSGGSLSLNVEMRFIKLAFGELQVNPLDVRQLVEEFTGAVRETWNRQTKLVRPVIMRAEVLGIPVELMPAAIWPHSEIDLMFSSATLTEEILPDIKFDTQVTYYVRIGEPQRINATTPKGVLARIRLSGRDNPDYTRHIDAVMAYNKLADDSRL